MNEIFEFLNDDSVELSEAKKELAEWKDRKKEAKQRFTAIQNLPYEVKVRKAEKRAIEFMEQMESRGCNAHVSVGGLDSITLLLFLRHMCWIISA